MAGKVDARAAVGRRTEAAIKRIRKLHVETFNKETGKSLVEKETIQTPLDITEVYRNQSTGKEIARFTLWSIIAKKVATRRKKKAKK